MPKQYTTVDNRFKEQIKSDVDTLLDGFIVTSSHMEDADRHGAKMVFECENNWCGWSWDLPYAIKEAKQKLYNNIVNTLKNEDALEKKRMDSIVYEIIFGKDH
jgi:hypothetical protein